MLIARRRNNTHYSIKKIKNKRSSIIQVETHLPPEIKGRHAPFHA
jgi:hypothetical protein